MTTFTERFLLALGRWLYYGIASIITGGASALSYAGSSALAHSVDQSFHIPSLKELGLLFITGGMVGGAAYFKQSPLPKIFGPLDTAFWKNSPNGQPVPPSDLPNDTSSQPKKDT